MTIAQAAAESTAWAHWVLAVCVLCILVLVVAHLFVQWSILRELEEMNRNLRRLDNSG